MNTSMEDRLRAHFADRSARDAFPTEAPTESPRVDRAAPRHRRTPLLLAAAATLAIAGTVGAILATRDDNPDTIDVIAPDTTTSNAPATTDAPPSTTTVPVASVLPPGQSVIVSRDGVVGSWDGERWIDSRDGTLARGGEHYTLLTLGRVVGEAIGGEPNDTCNHLGPRHQQAVAYDAPQEYRDDLWGYPLAVSGVANPFPRATARLLHDSAQYQDAARSILVSEGLDDPDVQLLQVLRADLEGDGVDEVIVVAEKLSPGAGGLFASEGDYSLVFVRRVVDEQVRTSVLTVSIGTSEPGYTPFVEFTRVITIADLNGDGVMEIVAKFRQYEGSGTGVFALTDTGLQLVLSVGCGA